MKNKIELGDTIYWTMPISDEEKIKVDLFVGKISELESPIAYTKNRKVFGYLPDFIEKGMGFKSILLIEKWKKYK